MIGHAESMAARSRVRVQKELVKIRSNSMQDHYRIAAENCITASVEQAWEQALGLMVSMLKEALKEDKNQTKEEKQSSEELKMRRIVERLENLVSNVSQSWPGDLESSGYRRGLQTAIKQVQRIAEI